MSWLGDAVRIAKGGSSNAPLTFCGQGQPANACLARVEPGYAIGGVKSNHALLGSLLPDTRAILSVNSMLVMRASSPAIGGVRSNDTLLGSLLPDMRAIPAVKSRLLLRASSPASHALLSNLMVLGSSNTRATGMVNSSSDMRASSPATVIMDAKMPMLGSLSLDTRATGMVKPTPALRASSPANPALKSTTTVPGSPLTRATSPLKPRLAVRASSPAKATLKSITTVPGSPLTRTSDVLKSKGTMRASSPAILLVKPKRVIAGLPSFRYARHRSLEIHKQSARVEPGHFHGEIHQHGAGLTFQENTMGIKSRRKGARIELEVLHQLQDAGLVAEKLSYAWRKTHDLRLSMLGRDCKLEIKSRANGFRQLYSWLEPVNLLIVRADRSEALAVLPLSTLIELIKKK